MMKRQKLYVAALQILAVLIGLMCGCGAHTETETGNRISEVSQEMSNVVTESSKADSDKSTAQSREESEAPVDEQKEPVSDRPMEVTDQDQIKNELETAIRELRQPRIMKLSGFELETPDIDVKNIYYGITRESPELKYAYGVTAELLDQGLACTVDYMPYKTGNYPDGFAGEEASDLIDLIKIAEEHIGDEPVPVRITNQELTPDSMNRALQQAGGGFILCSLNQDGTEICYSAPFNMTIEECMASLKEVDRIADETVGKILTDGMTSREQAEALYSYVTQTVSYDFRYYSNKAEMPYESQTALGALRDGTAICGGYSLAVKVLFEKAGIPCYTVSGKASGEHHMWNFARLDGEWFWFDATADRGCSPETGLRHFAMPELNPASYSWNQSAVDDLISEWE